MAELANLKLGSKSWPAGTHSLHYHHLFLSEPGPQLPQFLAVGYVNDQPFVYFDSRVGKAEPCAPWMAPVESWYWEKETRKLQGWNKIQKAEMKTVMGDHNHSSGTHSTQRTFGCEIREDGSVGGFWKFAYDGQDYLTLDLETLSWVAADSVALDQKRLLENQSCYAEYNKAYLAKLCVVSLHRYLELGGHNLTRREPPTVQVTEHPAQDGAATLRCWARGFYPRDISVSWWLGEKELSQDTERVETRPSGDGTYQTWAALHVMEKKAQYSCQVQHCGLNHTQNVPMDSPIPRSHWFVLGSSTIVFCFGLILYLTVLRPGGEPTQSTVL